MLTKLCSKCNKEQEITNFYVCKNGRVCSYCKTCQKLYDKERSEKSKLYSKAYRESHKDYFNNYNKSEKHRQSCKQFRINNPDSNQVYYNKNKQIILKRQAEKRKEYNNRLHRSVSARVYCCLKQNKNSKSTFNDILDYSEQDLRAYLESQFTSEISWDNYGTYWELDHIIPVNTFNFNDYSEFKTCWSLINLRPLEKSLNRQRPKDGSDISEELKIKILNNGV